MSVVHAYWQGALRRLQAEVDGFAKLVEHWGEQGRENELALARVLSSLIPGRFGTGSGLLIDSTDKQSPQTDVIVFEQAMEATLFAQTTQLLYPVEAAYAAVEVKTTLREEDITDFEKNSKLIRALTTTRPHLDGSEHPLTVLFAYSSWALPATALTHVRRLAPEHRPDLGCVVDAGLVFGRSTLLGWNANDDYAGGATFVYDDAGNRVTTTEKKMAIVGGVPYTVMRLRKDDAALVDPARGLLLFLEALLRAIHAKADGRSTILSAYVGDALRRTEPL